MRRSYERLKVKEFGAHLLSTGDLDPIYIALNTVKWGANKKLLWMVAYIAFYHAGVACYMVTHEKRFWELMLTAGKNEDPAPNGCRWPRGKERRHFRGSQAIKALRAWQQKWQEYPQAMFEKLHTPGMPVQDAIVRAKEIPSVGNWLGFKIADLMHSCIGLGYDQSDLTPFFYETPRKGLLRIYKEQIGIKEEMMDKVEVRNEAKVLQDTMVFLAELLSNFNQPHSLKLPLDAFCIETVACKYLSHLNGHYPLSNDITEIREGLEPWVKYSQEAQEFMGRLPTGEKIQ